MVMQFGYVLDFYNSIEVNLSFFFTPSSSRVEASMNPDRQSHLEASPCTSPVEMERTRGNGWWTPYTLLAALGALLRGADFSSCTCRRPNCARHFDSLSLQVTAVTGYSLSLDQTRSS
jgi:hypothetical protein